MTHKIGEAEQWLFEFLDRQAAFDDLMSKQEIEVMDENEDYALSLV